MKSFINRHVPLFVLFSLAVAPACSEDVDDFSGFGPGGGGPGGGEADDGDDDGDDDGSDPDDGNDGGDPTGGDPPDDDPPGDDGGTDDPGTDDPGDTDGPEDDTGGGVPPDGDIGDCSGFVSIEQFFTFMNNERATYGGEMGALPHSRYKGLPWQGEGHETWTFSTRFSWSDSLAEEAQEEAEALASGNASPRGSSIGDGNGFCDGSPFWIADINTADWTITASESPGDLEKPNDSCPPPFPLLPDNGSARQGLFYHDFGGDGPAINKMGIGAAIGEDCEVWWVLRFGP